jgi:hypothetical protein
MIGQILLVFALVCAVIAAVFMESVNRVSITIHFGWLALAFYVASLLFGGR